MKVVLFDVDNTMIKSTKAHTRAFIEGLSNVFGIDFKEEDFENAGPPGMTDLEIAIVAGERRGISREEILRKMKEISNAMAESFAKSIEKGELELLPGVRNLLEELKARSFTLGVMTGNFEKIAWIKLKRAKIDGFFSFGIFGGEAENKSMMGKVAMKKIRGLFGKEPSFICIIGDTPRDVEAGKLIGAKTIAVATGSATERELKQAKPDLLLKNLEDHIFILIWIVKASEA
ncbi:MAG: HAD hydrolase-like protein [Synergistetes bacterium]|nr:HAD hydrolase-like protein [Synergistota bacterium]